MYQVQKAWHIFSLAGYIDSLKPSVNKIIQYGLHKTSGMINISVCLNQAHTNCGHIILGASCEKLHHFLLSYIRQSLYCCRWRALTHLLETVFFWQVLSVQVCKQRQNQAEQIWKDKERHNWPFLFCEIKKYILIFRVSMLQNLFLPLGQVWGL